MICGARWSLPVCSECTEQARKGTDPADLDAIARALERAWAALDRKQQVTTMPAGKSVSIPVLPDTRDRLQRLAGQRQAQGGGRATYDQVISDALDAYEKQQAQGMGNDAE